MYNVHCTINVLRVSSRKIVLFFVILIPDDNLLIFCIRELPIRRWEKFLTSLEHLTPCIPSSSPGTYQCPSTDLARLLMLDVIKIRVNANCSINIYIGSNLIFSSHSYYILTTRLKKILEQTNFSVLWVPGAGTVTMTTPDTERVLKRIRMLRGQSFALVPIPINQRSIAGLVSSRTRTRNIGGITMINEPFYSSGN